MNSTTTNFNNPAPALNDTVLTTCGWNLVVKEAKELEAIQENHPNYAKHLAEQGIEQQLFLSKPRGKKMFLAYRLNTGRVVVKWNVSI